MRRVPGGGGGGAGGAVAAAARARRRRPAGAAAALQPPAADTLLQGQCTQPTTTYYIEFYIERQFLYGDRNTMYCFAEIFGYNISYTGLNFIY